MLGLKEYTKGMCSAAKTLAEAALEGCLGNPLFKRTPRKLLKLHQGAGLSTHVGYGGRRRRDGSLQLSVGLCSPGC